MGEAAKESRTGLSGSKLAKALVAATMAFSVALPMQALTADEAYAASAKPKITFRAGKTATVEVGAKVNLRGKINVTKGSKITYKSSKKSVAKVSEKGIVTTRKAGQAIITVKAKKGSNTATKKMKIKVVDLAAKTTDKRTLAQVKLSTTQKPKAASDSAGQPKSTSISASRSDASSAASASPRVKAAASTADNAANSNKRSQTAAPTLSLSISANCAPTKSANKPVAQTTALVATASVTSGNKILSASATSYNATAQKNGFVTESGKTYYYRNNAKVYGLFTVGSAKYYTNTSTGVLVTGWQRLSDGDRYFNPKDGGKMVTGRFAVPHTGGSNWYYFNANGIRQANILKDGYFYRASDGVMVANCWQRFSDGDRFFKADGKMATGVYTVSNNAYCFDSNGVRKAGLTANGYYFRPSDGVGMRIVSINAGTYEILSALGGDQRLDVAAAGTADMTNVQTYANTHSNAQVWSVQSAGGNYYTIINVNSGKALDVQGGGKANGTNVFQYTPNGTDAQKWMPVSCGGGVALINKASGKALDVAGGICGNCANAQSFDLNCTNAQIWVFSPQGKFLPSFAGTIYGTASERETAISIWNAYTAFRAQKNVPQVRWSNYCAKLAYDTCVAESRLGRMQHEIAIPANQQLTYSDILQYSTWRKSGVEAVDRWANSEGHHRMMRNNNGTVEAGVGVYFDGSKWWYTIVYNFNGCNQYQGTLW